MNVAPELVAAPTAQRPNVLPERSATPSLLGASMWHLDSADGFDDCDVALEGNSLPSQVSTPVVRTLTPPMRRATMSPGDTMPTASVLLDLSAEEAQPRMPTPLDCGIVALGWGVVVGVAGCVYDDAYCAAYIAGISVLSASVAAAAWFGGDAPYTERYGSATPVGTMTVAAGYLVVGLFGTATWQRATC